MHPSGIFMCAARLLVIDAIEVLHSARARVGELENLGHVPRTDVAVSRLVEHLVSAVSVVSSVSIYSKYSRISK